MVALVAGILVHWGGEPVTLRQILIFSLVVGVGLLVSICWQLLENWRKRTRGRCWPTVSAVIDSVGVILVDSELPSSGGVHNWPSYLATLTYSYRSPEERMGEYKRRFGNEEEARAWANSYKGETVQVHVNPRDSTESVLREEDL